MKKNLRIVSAAAAALLAVAPVAATAIATPATTVSAATYESNDSTDLGTKRVAYKAGQVESQLTDGLIKTPATLTASAAGTKVTLDYVNYAGGVQIAKEFGRAHTPGDAAVEANTTYKVTANYTYKVPTTVAAGDTIKIDGQTRTVSSSHEVKINFSMMVRVVKPADLEKGYFAYRNNSNQLVWVSGPEASNSSVYANTDALSANNEMFEGVNKDTDKITIKHAKAVVKKLLSAGEDADKASGASSKIDWKQVWKDSKDFASQLRSQGITVSTDGTTFIPGNKMFHFNILANNGDTVTVYFQNDNARNTTDPVLVYRTSSIYQYNGNTRVEYGNWERLVTRYGNVHAVMVEQSDNGTFQPSQYIGAWNNENQKALIGNVEFSDSNVNLQVPGLYHVTVKATNAAGKTTTATEVPVIVYARNGKQMTVIANGDVYTESNGAMVKANNLNYEHVVNPGNQLRVYDKKTVNGTDYYRIISANTNAWVKASDLKDGVVTPATQETTKTITIMHIAAIYDKNGKKTNESSLRAYDTYSVVSEPVTINGAKFYKLAGKDQYIKVGNVDGTKRTLKKNSYVYKNTLELKRNKHKKVTNKKLSAGSTVTTYGKSFMIKGHQVYRIGKNQYVKKANF